MKNKDLKDLTFTIEHCGQSFIGKVRSRKETIFETKSNNIYEIKRRHKEWLNEESVIGNI